MEKLLRSTVPFQQQSFPHAPRDASPRRLRTRITCALTLLALLIVSALPAAAQCDPSYDPECIGSGDGIGPDVGITPDGGSYTDTTGAGVRVSVSIVFTDPDGLRQSTASVTVTNGGSTTPVSGLSWTSSASPTLGRLQGEITLSPGTSVLTAQISDTYGAVGIGRATYTVTVPDPDLPIIYSDPHHNEFRDTTAGAVVLRYSLPAYTSRGVERTAGLFYTTEQANPTGFVQLDAAPDPRSGSQIVALSLHITDLQDRPVTREMFWQKGSAARQRLAAWWSMAGSSTGAYMYWAVVRSYRSDGSYKQSRVPVRVLVLNESGSRYGWGWSVAGVQRIYPAGNGALLHEGNGILRWFEKYSCSTAECTYRTPAGDFTRLVYDAAGGVWRRTYTDGTVATFSAAGLMTSTRDRFGAATTFVWQNTQDGQNVAVLSQIVDPANRITYFGYHYSWYLKNITQTTEPEYRSAWFWYSGIDLSHIYGPSNFFVSYDGDHLPHSYTDDSGTWNVSYDAFRSVKTLTAPAIVASGQSVRPVTTYRSIRDTTLLQPAAGTGLTNLAPPLASEAATATVTDAGGHTTAVLSDRYGNPLRTTDAGGFQTQNFFSEDGLPTSLQGEHHTGFTWNANGQLLLKTINGAVAYMASYNASLQLEYESAGGAVQWYAYGPRGELLASWYGRKEDMERKKTTYEYDTLYRLIRRTEPTGARAEWSYGTNAWQNVEVERVIRDGGVAVSTSYTYDGFGRVRTVTNPEGQTVTTEYDVLNRPLSVTDSTGRATRFAYTGAHLSRVTDPAGKIYELRYNARGWLEAEVFPDGKTRTYRYDADGLLIGSTDRRGIATSITYDARHRPYDRISGGATTNFRYPDHYTTTISNGEVFETFKTVPYVGVIDSVTSSIGSRNFEIKRILDPENGYSLRGIDFNVYYWNWLARTDRVRYAPNHQPADTSLGMSLAVQDLSGRTTDLGFDTAGRLVRTLFPNGITHYNWFTSDGRLSSTSFSNSTVNGKLSATFGYDTLNRLSSRADASGQKIWEYGYDTLGQVTAYAVSTSGYPPGCNPSYEECPPVWFPVSSETYTYDTAGNRTDRGGSVETNSNRYRTFDGFTMEYDAEGNVTRKYKPGVLDQRFAWNGLGQLESVITNGSVVTYGYSGSGRRIRRTEGGVSTYFVYDDDDLLVELDGNLDPYRSYTYLPGTDRPLSVRINSAGQLFDYYYVVEHPGHVTGLLNTLGGVAAEYRYKPFGERESSSTSASQPLQFMARELDPTTGLYYMRNRWYDTALARFLSEDPIGLAGGINSYAFGGNDPLNRRDPSGMAGCVYFIYITQEVWKELGPSGRQQLADWGICPNLLGEDDGHNTPLRGADWTPRAPRSIMDANPLADDLMSRRMRVQARADAQIREHQVRACQRAMFRDGMLMQGLVFTTGTGGHFLGSAWDKYFKDMEPRQVTGSQWRRFYQLWAAVHAGVALGTGIDMVACYFDPTLNH